MAMSLLFDFVSFQVEDEVPAANFSIRDDLLSASIEREEMVFNLYRIADHASYFTVNLVERLLRVRHTFSP